MAQIIITETTTPASPATGKQSLFIDSTSHNLNVVNSSGAVTQTAPIASPTFTGTPAAPTAAADTNTTQLATTAYVIGQAYAKLASPTFTGTPTLPTGTICTTQAADDSSTKAATTAFVLGQAATQAELETATSTSKFSTAGRQHFHPKHTKVWGRLDLGTGITAGSGIGSCTDTGTGDKVVTFTTAFSSATGYACQVQVEMTTTTFAVAADRKAKIKSATLAAASVSIQCIDSTATTNLIKDPSSWHFAAWGDL